MQRSVTHATFAVERRYPAAPARVFAAWASPDAKKSWFACHAEWRLTEYALDFRVGGREHLSTSPGTGPAHIYDAQYHDIVPDRRMVYAYTMHLGPTRISVSLATVELEPAGQGTRLLFTEQGAFLDGYDDVSGREHGTRVGLDNLEAALRRGL